MFEIAFSFQGRLKRLHYFVGVMALGMAYACGLTGIFVGGAVAAAHHNWLVVVLLALAILPLGIAVIWCSLALQARRIRDMGWQPAIVITSWILFNVADRIIFFHLVPALAAPPALHVTYPGLAINAALSLALLFWPSADDDVYDAASRVFDDVAYAPPPALAAPVAPRLAQAAGPVAFGRRGLR